MNYAAIRSVLVARMHLSEAETADARNESAETEAEAMAKADAAIDARYDDAKDAKIVAIAAACCSAVAAGVTLTGVGAKDIGLIDASSEGFEMTSKVANGAGTTLQVAMAPTGASDDAGTEASIAQQEAEVARANAQGEEASAMQSEDRLRQILLSRPQYA